MSRVSLAIEDIVIVENNAFFFALDFNGLYSMSMTEQKVHLCGRVPWEPLAGERLFGSIAEVDGKIYLIPFSAHSIAVYSVETSEFTKIELKEEMSRIDYLFMAVEKVGKDLFLFGVKVPYIVKLDTVTNKMTYLQDWHSGVAPFIFNKADAFFRRQVVTLGNKFYIPFCNANAILEFNVNTLESTIHVIGEEARGYSGICFDGENFWCSPRKKQDCLLRWNRETDEKMYVSAEENDAYLGIVYYNNQVKPILGSIYNFAKYIGKDMIYFEKKGNTLVMEGEKTNKKCCISVDNAEIPLKEILMKKIIKETKEIPLKVFIEILIHDEMPDDKSSSNHISIGEKIYGNCI